MKTQFFRLLSALIKVHPIPLVIFETTRSGFIQILHHCSVSWKITLLHLFQLKPYILWTKRAHQSKTFRLSTAQVKSQNCTLTGSFYWKYIKLKKKSIEELCLMTLTSDVEFEEKLICCFKNEKNLVNFDSSTWKSRQFPLWLVPFVQSI